MNSNFISCKNIPTHLKNAVLEINDKMEDMHINYCFIGSIAMGVYGCLSHLESLPDVSYADLSKIYAIINRSKVQFETLYAHVNANANYHREVNDIDILIDFADIESVISLLRSLDYKFGQQGRRNPPPMKREIQYKTSISMFRDDITIDIVNQQKIFNGILNQSNVIFNFEIPLLKPEHLIHNKIEAFLDRLDLKDLYDIWFYDYIKHRMATI